MITSNHLSYLKFKIQTKTGFKEILQKFIKNNTPIYNLEIEQLFGGGFSVRGAVEISLQKLDDFRKQFEIDFFGENIDFEALFMEYPFGKRYE